MCFTFSAFGQGDGQIRGTVLNEKNGEPMIFTTVYLKGTTYGTSTDINGLYTIPKVPQGSYTLMVTSIGFDTIAMSVEVIADKVTNQNLVLKESEVQLDVIEISAKTEERRNNVQISTTKITPNEIKKIPSIGGEADIAQYLQVLPGVIFTGDQGGQLYIRGGSPIQTRVLLDGVTIYNPFHSIGLFSVFETDIIRNVDVMTGGFNAEYGGRVSAVVDITTKDGNKKELAGKIAGNPFLAKAILEGPLMKLKPNGSSISFILTGKHSYLNRTSKGLYKYVNDTLGIPYSFTDYYGKLSFNAAGGSSFSVFGFRNVDKVDFENVARFEWDALGLGTNFRVVPGQGGTIIDGSIAFSNYDIAFQQAEEKQRTSSIGGFNINLNFTYFVKDGDLRYGIGVNGFSTDFSFFNSLGIQQEQIQNTTELGFYIKYKKVIGDKLVIEPGMRIDYYASLSNFSPEPRLGMKFNVHDRFRLKAATGLYAQNFISSKADQDVVDLFTGFLSAPEGDLTRPDGSKANHRLQKAWHFVGGMETEPFKNVEVDIEGYYKLFTQLINLNRNKVSSSDPDFEIETGDAYGIDFLVKYENKGLYLWTAYSLAWVTRDNGEQEFAPFFDRRHNLNFVASYRFGKSSLWEASARWNLGSGFPFTRTQGFYEFIDFLGGVSTEYTTQNGDLGIQFEDELNAGRLPTYHRFDLSLKREIPLSTNTLLEIVVSVTNIYDRENIFYFDRIRFERVDQLPILPSLGLTLSF